MSNTRIQIQQILQRIFKISLVQNQIIYLSFGRANSPWKQLKDMNVEAQGIKISTGAPDIPALKQWMH